MGEVGVERSTFRSICVLVEVGSEGDECAEGGHMLSVAGGKSDKLVTEHLVCQSEVVECEQGSSFETGSD